MIALLRSLVLPFLDAAILVVCAGLLAIGCAGGSGSSGFNVSESLVLERVTRDGECEEFEGLTICPADSAPIHAPSPSFTPTTSPTDGFTTPSPGVTATVPQPPPTSTPTATVDGTQGPTEPTGTATSTATPEPSSTPTATAMPSLAVLTTFFGMEDTLSCQATDSPGSCAVTFEFTPTGFSGETAFRIASRRAGAEGPWDIQAPTPIAQPANIFNYRVEIQVDRNQPTSDAGGIDLLQVVVLAFDSEPGPVPDRVDTLSATGADFAFVVPSLAIALP